MPLNDETADLVTAMEVIEHLINPDNMMKEVRRVLRPGGYFLLITPNLASWVNRIIFLLGHQPYNAEVSTVETFGVPLKLWKPSGHIRPFTLRVLKEMLAFYGFRIIDVKGSGDINPSNKAFKLLDSLLAYRPSLARRLIVLAKKP